MAVIENNVLMRVKDSEGNANLLYPITKADNVEGLSDALATKADAAHTHAVADVDGLQTALDGKADTSHGTHVTFSDTAPKVAQDTPSAGTATTVARSDHVHPAQTDITGNANTANAWTNARIIDGRVINGKSDICTYDICSTAGSVAMKEAAFSTQYVYPLQAGAEFTIYFTQTNTVAEPSLKLRAMQNTYPAIPMHYRGSPLPAGYPKAGSVYTFRYNPDAKAYDIVGDIGLPATGDTLGLVKSGGDCTISAGVISVIPNSHEHIVQNIRGLDSALTKFQTALNGKADISHGTHVTFSDTAPKVAQDTPSAGTATTVARSDHVHPAQFHATTADVWATPRTINGLWIRGDSDICTYFTCPTEGAKQIKQATYTSSLGYMALSEGVEFTVKFTNTNTVSDPKLYMPRMDTNTDGRPIYYNGSPLPAGYPEAGSVYTFRFDGTNYDVVGGIGLPSTGDTLGLVKSGGDCTITDGVITVKDNSHEHIVQNIRGLDSALTKFQTALNGKADTSHGTHVTFSDDNPKVADTASAGTATTVARSDHVHPAQTDITGNANTATKWANARIINGMIIDGTSNVSNCVTCSTEGAVQNKEVTISLAWFSPLTEGGELTVKFSNTNTVADPNLTLCHPVAGAITTKSIHYRGTTLPAGYPEAGSVYTFRYNSDTKAYDIVGGIGLPATGDTLGLVKTGGDCIISDGVITVNDDSHNHIIQNVDGLQSALDAKASTSDLNTSIDALRQELLGDTPVEAYNTFTELAAYIEEHQDAADALTSAIGSKADKATTLSGYGITDAYTKTEVDAKISEAIAAALATL